MSTVGLLYGRRRHGAVGPTKSPPVAKVTTFPPATNGNRQLLRDHGAGRQDSNLKPATGRSISAGLDLDVGKFAGVLDGLLINATYWDVAYRGLITNQQTQNNIPQLTSHRSAAGHRRARRS